MRIISEEESEQWLAIRAALSRASASLEDACALMQRGKEPFCPLETWNPAWALINHVQNQVDTVINELCPRVSNTKKTACWTSPRVGGAKCSG